MIDKLKQQIFGYRHYAYTFAAQMLTLLLTIGSLKLAAISFDGHAFGLYNIVRRVISLLNFPLLIGLGISIPIYVAKGKKDTQAIAPYILNAILYWIIATVVLLLLNGIAGNQFALFLFEENKTELMLPLIISFSALYLYTILYAIYRGEQDFWKANAFQMLAPGLMPVLAILFCHHSVYHFLWYNGLLWMTCDLMVLFHIYQKGLLKWSNIEKLKQASKEILRFGLPRVPGEFALFGLMAFPLFYIAKYVSFEKAGYVAVGFTLVQLVASLFEFMGTILLPKTAILLAEGAFLKLYNLVNKMLLISFLGSATISAFIYLNLQWILGLLDKSKFQSANNEMKVIIFCIPFYILYLILRNPMDALVHKPYNMFNLVLCFGIQMIVLFFGTHFFSFGTIYTLSVALPLLLLGVLTLIRWQLTIKKHFG